jgi:hypothetical protein
VIAVGAGALLVGLSAPGAALVLAAIALVILLSGWRLGRLTLLAAAGPVLFAAGLGLLAPAVAGLVPRWPARLWAACAVAVATVAWQVGAGTDALLAGGGFTVSAVEDLDGQNSPPAAARRFWQPLLDHPQAGLQVGIMIVAAMCVPLVLRARAGGPRAIVATSWVLVLVAALVATAGDTASALGATIPAGIVVIGWALRPWRSLRRRAPARASATLRGRIV